MLYRRYDEYVTHEMALDAGEPQMEGQPCGERYVADEDGERFYSMGEAVYKALVDDSDAPLCAAELREYALYSGDIRRSGWAERILLAVADALEGRGGGA